MYPLSHRSGKAQERVELPPWAEPTPGSATAPVGLPAEVLRGNLVRGQIDLAMLEMSLRAVAAAAQGHLNERGRAYNPKSVSAMLAR